MKIFVLIVLFIFIGGFFIVSQENLNLSKTADLEKFFSFYKIWLGEIFDNSFETIGYAVKLEWLPNQTIDN